MAHDVFISYASDDKLIADAVCASLESHNCRCWIAPRDATPGAPYAESIVDAIKSCRAMVLVFSAGSNASPQVLREVERAVNAGIAILPFRIQDIKPSKSMEYFISASHWLDALTPPIEHHLDRLVDVVVRLVSDGEPAPQPVATKASSHNAMLFELGYSLAGLMDGNRQGSPAAQQLVIELSGLFTRLNLTQPEGWQRWGTEDDFDSALLTSFGVMKALLLPLGEKGLGHFHLGFFMWLYGRMTAQPRDSGIKILKTHLDACNLPDAVQSKVLRFFEGLNSGQVWETGTEGDWADRSQSLVALITEVQQQLRDNPAN